MMMYSSSEVEDFDAAGSASTEEVEKQDDYEDDNDENVESPTAKGGKRRQHRHSVAKTRTTTTTTAAASVNAGVYRRQRELWLIFASMAGFLIIVAALSLANPAQIIAEQEVWVEGGDSYLAANLKNTSNQTLPSSLIDQPFLEHNELDEEEGVADTSYSKNLDQLNEKYNNGESIENKYYDVDPCAIFASGPNCSPESPPDEERVSESQDEEQKQDEPIAQSSPSTQESGSMEATTTIEQEVEMSSLDSADNPDADSDKDKIVEDPPVEPFSEDGSDESDSSDSQEEQDGSSLTDRLSSNEENDTTEVTRIDQDQDRNHGD